jgi:transposase
MQNMINIPLNLPAVTVVNTEIKEDGTVLISVESTEEGTCCSKCGQHITKPYGSAPERQVRHTSVFDSEVYISFTPKRFECSDCEGNPTTVQRVAWIKSGSSYTSPFEEHILLQLVNSTIEDVSIKENITYDSIEGIIDRHINKKINWNEIKSLNIIGVDEFSVKKGHKNFLTIISTQINNKPVVLSILKGRKKDTVKEFFPLFPKGYVKPSGLYAVTCILVHDNF